MTTITNTVGAEVVVAMQHIADMRDVIASQFGNHGGGLALSQVPEHEPLTACDHVAGSAIPSFQFILLQMWSNAQLFRHTESIHPKLV